MATLGDIVINLRMNHRSVTTGARRSRSELGGLGTVANATTGSISRLSAVMGGMAAIAGGLAIKFGVGLAAEAETAQVSFETLLGSADLAKQTLEDLQTFAASTPFQLPGLRDAAKTLIAFGTDQREVITDLRRLGDVSALSGKDLGELSTMYGKARINQRLFGDDVTRFAEAGLPIYAELTERFGVTGAALRKLVESGAATFDVLEASLIKATSAGGRFAGGMAKQSKTLSGVFSTLKDNVALLTRGIGEELVDALDLKGRASQMIALVSSLREPIVGMVRGIRDFVNEHPRLFRFVGGFLALAIAIKGTIVVAGLLKVALLALNVNPLVLSLTLIATLLVELIGEGDSFGAKFGSVVDKLASGFDRLRENILLFQGKVAVATETARNLFAGGSSDMTAQEFTVAFKVGNADLSGFRSELAESLKTAKGFESVMGGLQAGQQNRGLVLGALTEIAPKAALNDLEQLLIDFKKGKQTTDQLANSIARLAAETKGAGEIAGKTAITLTDSEKIGNTADKAASSMRAWEDRVITLKAAVKDGALSQQQYNTAIRAQADAYDKLTGGAVAYIAKLEQEIALVGLSAEQRKRAELSQAGADTKALNRVSELQAELTARNEIHAATQKQTALDTAAAQQIANLQRELFGLSAQQITASGLPAPDLSAASGLQSQLTLLEKEKTIRDEILASQLKLAQSLHGSENVRLAEIFKIDAGKLAEVAKLANLDQFDLATQLGLGVKQAEQLLAILNNNKAAQAESPQATSEPQKTSSAALVGSGEVYSRILAATRQGADPALKEAKKQTKATKEVVSAVNDVKVAIEDNEGVLIA